MPNIFSKIWNYLFENPPRTHYEFDQYERDGFRTMAMPPPNPLLRQRWEDENSMASSSNGSWVSFTRTERERAEDAGLVRPGSKLKLKWKRGKTKVYPPYRE